MTEHDKGLGRAKKAIFSSFFFLFFLKYGMLHEFACHSHRQYIDGQGFDQACHDAQTV